MVCVAKVANMFCSHRCLRRIKSAEVAYVLKKVKEAISVRAAIIRKREELLAETVCC